jgi:putative membrane protein
MSQSVTAAGPSRFEVRVTCWVRTRLSLERTMMSWLRTATALIGFAIVQYFNHLPEMLGARAAYLPNAPEFLGLALIAASRRCSSRSGSTAGPFTTSGADPSRQSPA